MKRLGLMGGTSRLSALKALRVTKKEKNYNIKNSKNTQNQPFEKTKITTKKNQQKNETKT